MTVKINGQTYYRTSETCRLVGVSRNTLYRLVRLSIFSQTERRDHRGWRLFAGADIEQLKAQTSRIEMVTPGRNFVGQHKM